LQYQQRAGRICNDRHRSLADLWRYGYQDLPAELFGSGCRGRRVFHAKVRQPGRSPVRYRVVQKPGPVVAVVAEQRVLATASLDRPGIEANDATIEFRGSRNVVGQKFSPDDPAGSGRCRAVVRIADITARQANDGTLAINDRRNNLICGCPLFSYSSDLSLVPNGTHSTPKQLPI